MVNGKFEENEIMHHSISEQQIDIFDPIPIC